MWQGNKEERDEFDDPKKNQCQAREPRQKQLNQKNPPMHGIILVTKVLNEGSLASTSKAPMYGTLVAKSTILKKLLPTTPYSLTMHGVHIIMVPHQC